MNHYFIALLILRANESIWRLYKDASLSKSIQQLHWSNETLRICHIHYLQWLHFYQSNQKVFFASSQVLFSSINLLTFDSRTHIKTTALAREICISKFIAFICVLLHAFSHIAALLHTFGLLHAIVQSLRHFFARLQIGNDTDF